MQVFRLVEVKKRSGDQQRARHSTGETKRGTAPCNDLIHRKNRQESGDRYVVKSYPLDRVFCSEKDVLDNRRSNRQSSDDQQNSRKGNMAIAPGTVAD